MDGKETNSAVCQIDNEHKPPHEIVPAALVRPAIVETIRKRYPGWSADGYICHEHLDQFRAEYVQDALEAEKGELSQLETA